MGEQDVKITFREAFAFIIRGALPALLVGVLAAAIAFLVSRDPVPVYRSTAILLATMPASGYAGTVNVVEPTQIDPDIYRSLVFQGGLLEKSLSNVFAEPLTDDELAAWFKQVKVRVDEGLISNLVRIEVESPDPSQAALVANAVADGLIAWDRDRVGTNVEATVSSLDRSLVLLGAQLAAAEQAGDTQGAQVLRATREQRLSQLRSAEALRLSVVVLGLLEPFKSATIDDKPVNDRTVFNTAVAFVVAALFTYVLLFFLRVTDARVRNEEDVERVVGSAPLASIPTGARNSRLLEAFGRMSVALPSPPHRENAAAEARPARGLAVLITSATSAQERGLTARNLAAAYARGGWRVLLVDADLKEAVVTASMPSLGKGPNLMDLLARGEHTEPYALSRGQGPDLAFVPAGPVPVDGAALILARALPPLLKQWRARYDVVVIDAPALDNSAGAAALAGEVDAVVLVAMRYRTRLAALRNAVRELARADGAVVTSVLLDAANPRTAVSASLRATNGGQLEAARVNAPRARVVEQVRRGR